MPIQTVAFAIALLFSQAQGERPREVQSITERADVHRRAGRFDEAIATYRQALAIDPAYLTARRGLGQVFDLMGRHADARAEYLAALDGRTQSYESAPLFYSLAASYVFDRRFDDAHAALERWETLMVKRRGEDRSDPLAFFDLAMAADAFDEAERRLGQHYGSIEKPPANASSGGDPHSILAQLQWMRYNADRAVVAARCGHVAEAQGFMAEADAEGKTIAEAVAAIVAAEGGSGPSSLNPSRELMAPQGEVAFWLGDNTRAIQMLSGLSFKSAHHNVLLGQAYEREHNLGEARAAYTRVVESTELSIDLAWARPIAQARLAAIGR